MERASSADPAAVGPQRLRALDQLASDVRGLLRRAARVRQQSGAVELPGVAGEAAELLASCERLLSQLEEARQAERVRSRRLLRGLAVEGDEP